MGRARAHDTQRAEGAVAAATVLADVPGVALAHTEPIANAVRLRQPLQVLFVLEAVVGAALEAAVHLLQLSSEVETTCATESENPWDFCFSQYSYW